MEKILSCFASTWYGIFTCVSMYWHYWILYKENISIFELISESWQVFRENILVTFFLPTSLCEYYFSPYGFYRIIWIILFICLYLKFISSILLPYAFLPYSLISLTIQKRLKISVWRNVTEFYEYSNLGFFLCFISIK